MMFSAIVTASDHCLVANLSDGRQMEADSVGEMAKALHVIGVQAGAVSCQWQAGQRMMTAGQQVALMAALRSHEIGRHSGRQSNRSDALRRELVALHLSLPVRTGQSIESPSRKISLVANNQSI